MTRLERLEQDLPSLLAELAPRAKPDYRDDIVRQTALMRQRPAWMFPERWLPVSAITTRAFPAPPIRWRVVGMVALLILALAVSLALVAGSRPRVPAPFGPAGNGVVAFEKGGNIFTADAATGVVTTVVANAYKNVRPVFSGDGTHIVFERESGDLGSLFVARADGSQPVEVTPQGGMAGFDPFELAIPQYAFSPDGKEILFLTSYPSGALLWVAQADGSGTRKLDVPMTVLEAAYLPPDGARLVVAGSTNFGTTSGLYVLDSRTGAQLGTIVAPDPATGIGFIRVSPDGSRVAYVASLPGVDGPSAYRVHVAAVDGSSDITLPLPDGAVFEDAPAWSNDGTRLAIVRGYQQHNEEMAIAIVPADGTGTGVETEHGITGCCDTILQWAPDDSSVLVVPEDQTGADPVPTQHLLVSPLTGKATAAPWTGTDPPTWQRLAR
jgi:dipeptidyl aminopeptidase/acylaminoacyl peptidase